MQAIKQKKSTMRFALPIRALSIQQFMALIGKAPTIKGLARVPRRDKWTITVKKKDVLGAQSELIEGRRVSSFSHSLRSLKYGLAWGGLYTLTPKQAADVGRVLAFMHKNGLRWGDFHQRNILIDRKGQVKFLDFEAANITGKKWTGFQERGPGFILPAQTKTNLSLDSPKVKLNPEMYYIKNGVVYRIHGRKRNEWEIAAPIFYEVLGEKKSPDVVKTVIDEQRKLLRVGRYLEERKQDLLKQYEGKLPEEKENEYKLQKRIADTMISAYMEELASDPLTFKGKSIFDFKKKPYVRDIK
jgi:serine/threonine protein kinase